jgi:hypothetical protein
VLRGSEKIISNITNTKARLWGFNARARGDHSLLYLAYTCVRDLFIGRVIYLAKKIIR